MTSARRPRFSVRLGRSEAEHDGPFEGVPAHLRDPLQSWVDDFLTARSYKDEETARAVCLRLRISAPGRGRSGGQYSSALAATQDDELLDVIDELLAYKAERRSVDRDAVHELAALLDFGGSAYRVAEALDGLEERVTPAVRDAVRQTITAAAAEPAVGSAADHLAAAWQSAYGRSPDPVRAYSESIKAAEAAAHAVVQPNHPKATLGTMLGEIKNARHKFSTVLATPPGGEPISHVEAMMRALWDGQTSRHGAQNATVHESLEASRAAVHLAAALVQEFVSGAVTRTA
ncbi:hypothetical protein [Streptomyces violascens]|uniref:Uncharacterized protein n=1 Tax=Streptomyces violascens TaxID=67381 RepID=A0ABQ3QL64_9ACTN|nr:hypothetical protein [Streptomyces violascens]GGU44528.1 hypothetical protein GCM10010289_76390 [Streptomyces violascens]GHI38010.1 hypothetical protein Sviol_24180 [Streptomyces violascens]